MPGWNELVDEFGRQKDPDWLQRQLIKYMSAIAELRGNSTVILYASAFLQQRSDSSIASEDVNGLMNALYGAKIGDDGRLTLILHTPGGELYAVESIVDYLHAKFEYIEVIVPFLAMSAGAMIGLASDLVVLGKHSQLGPIDPQISSGQKWHSARAIQEGFHRAKEDILQNTKLAHLWAPILQYMGPSLMIEADKSLRYSKELVVKWLTQRMFAKESDAGEKIQKIASYFNAEQSDKLPSNVHMHGQRIGLQKMQELGVKTEILENKQKLQDAVLSAYHVMTMIFDSNPASKIIVSNSGGGWIKVPRHPLPRPNPAKKPRR